MLDFDLPPKAGDECVPWIGTGIVLEVDGDVILYQHNYRGEVVERVDNYTVGHRLARREKEERELEEAAAASWKRDCEAATRREGPRPSEDHIPWVVRGEVQGWYVPQGSDLRPRHTAQGTGRFD